MMESIKRDSIVHRMTHLGFVPGRNFNYYYVWKSGQERVEYRFGETVCHKIVVKVETLA